MLNWLRQRQKYFKEAWDKQLITYKESGDFSSESIEANQRQWDDISKS